MLIVSLLSVSRLVAQLLVLALQLVPGLLTFIVASVGNLVGTLHLLKVVDVISVLGLPSLI